MKMIRVIYYWTSLTQEKGVRLRRSYCVMAPDKASARRAADVQIKRAFGSTFEPDFVMYEEVGALHLEWSGIIDEGIYTVAKSAAKVQGA